MQKIMGWMTAAALALSLSALSPVAVAAKGAKADKASTEEGSSAGMSKDEADKLKEHNKLRGQIARMKFPATKAEIVSHVKGMKTDDKKWFEQTLPEKTYTSADDVYSALGWPTEPAPEKSSGK